MNLPKILSQIESAKGKEKLSILKDNVNNTQLRTLLDLAYNFNYKYYIKKFSFPTSFSLVDVSNLDNFVSLCETLKSQQFRGSAATKMVEDFLSSCTESEAKWFARALLRDLSCGIDVDTINKTGFDIPAFEVQLAKDGKSCKKLDDIIAKGAYSSPKFDGYRCLAYVDNKGTVTLYSRNGTIFENFPGVAEDLSKFRSIVFDGEIMSERFSAVQKSAFANKRKTIVGDVKYHIFDCIPMHEWESDDFKTIASVRYKSLEAIEFDSDRIVVVKHNKINSLEDISRLESEYIALGYEGVMVNPDIPYYRGKVSNKMLKFKTFLSMDCKIVGIIEGTGKYLGSMGAVKVEQENGKICEVGSGFNDEDRDFMWNKFDEFLGKTIEIKYQELTDDGIMRFPVFVRFRNDK